MPDSRRSNEARALVAAQDRLVAKGQSKGRAAARLLPQQSPESAARYLRKLRSGERTGREVAQREPIRRRLAILVPERLRDIGLPGDRPSAMVDVDTDRGPRTAKARLPYATITPQAFMRLPGYPKWKALVEDYWYRVLGYRAIILRVTRIRLTRANAGRKAVIRLDPYVS